MKKFLLALMVVSSLLFGADHKAELSATLGGVKPEGNLDMEDSLVYGLRFGTYLEDMAFDMLEFGFERANSVDYENTSSSTNINRIFVDLIKEYELTKQTSLYALAGIGYENIRKPLLGNDDDGFVQYGVGIKQWLSDSFALKAEVRHGITFEGNNNLFYTLGFTIPLGKKSPQIAPVKEEPVVAPIPPKAEEPVVEKKQVVVDNDIDKDGVSNTEDKCPNTPVGKVVDENGCRKIIRLHVNFDFDKYDVKKAEMDKIEKVVEFLNENPTFSVVLDGHTDSKGSEKYNLSLAQKRAQEVAKVLVAKGIDAKKIVTNSFGETQPIATNDTEEGRAQNRRVDAHFDK